MALDTNTLPAIRPEDKKAAQTAADRAALSKVYSLQNPVVAAGMDLATLPGRGLAGAYNTATRLPRAFGVDLPTFSDVPGGNDFSSMTPYFDQLRTPEAITPVAPVAPIAPERTTFPDFSGVVPLDQPKNRTSETPEQVQAAIDRLIARPTAPQAQQTSPANIALAEYNRLMGKQGGTMGDALVARGFMKQYQTLKPQEDQTTLAAYTAARTGQADRGMVELRQAQAGHAKAQTAAEQQKQAMLAELLSPDITPERIARIHSALGRPAEEYFATPPPAYPGAPPSQIISKATGRPVPQQQTVPPGHVAALKAGTVTAAEFDSLYGVGAAKQVTGK